MRWFCSELGLRCQFEPDPPRLRGCGYVQIVNESATRRPYVQAVWREGSRTRHACRFGRLLPADFSPRPRGELAADAAAELLRIAAMPDAALRVSRRRSVRMFPASSLVELAFKMKALGGRP